MVGKITFTTSDNLLECYYFYHAQCNGSYANAIFCTLLNFVFTDLRQTQITVTLHSIYETESFCFWHYLKKIIAYILNNLLLHVSFSFSPERKIKPYMHSDQNATVCYGDNMEQHFHENLS